MELVVAIGLLVIWTVFSIVYVNRFKKYQFDKSLKESAFWNNQYIFDTIPSVFPTLGILGTAIGITVGLAHFDTNNIQNSLPQLLNGLKSAFWATILGIIGLIVFQKYLAFIQQQIDNSPDRPIKSTDELTALGQLNLAVQNLGINTTEGFKGLSSKSREDNKLLIQHIIKLETELKLTTERIKVVEASVNTASKSNSAENKQVSDYLKELKDEQIGTGRKANENTLKIIEAMSSNNELVRKKFDEFSDLLAKNNTEALVEVMKTATEQFNAQMKELINKLVQENFKELNTSVQSLNNWQKENKEQIEKLTSQFIDVSQNLQISAKTLNEVAQKTKELTADNGKLSELIITLQNVLINDTKFMEMTDKIDKAITSIKDATDGFGDVTNHVNNWANKQSIFNDKIQTVIVQLDEFKNFNGNLWDSYRKEMSGAVLIVRQASQSLNSDLERINQEFYERLNNTLANLDACIQRFMIGK
jgi:hypothetical protein